MGVVLIYVASIVMACAGLALALNYRGFARWYSRIGRRIFFLGESEFDYGFVRILGAALAIWSSVGAILLTYALIHAG